MTRPLTPALGGGAPGIPGLKTLVGRYSGSLESPNNLVDAVTGNHGLRKLRLSPQDLRSRNGIAGGWLGALLGLGPNSPGGPRSGSLQTIGGMPTDLIRMYCSSCY